MKQQLYNNLIIFGAVAQLARAPALQAGGQEFDSPQLHHTNLNVSKIAHWKIYSRIYIKYSKKKGKLEYS